MIKNSYKKPLDRLTDGLLKYAIKENLSLEDLNEKIDVIMDALGLNTEVEKEEPKTEKTEDTSVDNIDKEDFSLEQDTAKEDVVEETTETEDEEVEESLSTDKGKYKIEFLDSRAYATYLQELDSYIKYFNTIEEVINYLTEKDFISYSGVNTLIKQDEEKDRGLLYIADWYEVSKN